VSIPILAGVDCYALDIFTLSPSLQTGKLWKTSREEIIALLDGGNQLIPAEFNLTDWDRLVLELTARLNVNPHFSFFLARLDRQGGFDFHSSNCPPQLFLRAGGIIQDLSSPAGSSLGDGSGDTLRLDSGEIVLLYTPGLISLANPIGEEFGLMQLKSLLLQNQHRTCEEIGLTIAQAAWLHHGRIMLPSLTLMIFKIL
jgi:hypothetical protein